MFAKHMLFQGQVGLPGLQGPPGDYGPVGREGQLGRSGRKGEPGYSGTEGPKGLRVHYSTFLISILAIKWNVMTCLAGMLL